jgi:osmotically-inducible protein OsmY
MGKTKDIREAVEAELSYDPLIDSANISVKNIDGDVALNGTGAGRRGAGAGRGG